MSRKREKRKARNENLKVVKDKNTFSFDEFETEVKTSVPVSKNILYLGGIFIVLTSLIGIIQLFKWAINLFIYLF